MKEIKNTRQYERALNRIEELLLLVDNNTPSSNADFMELDKLSDLVSDYEMVNFPVAKPSLIDIIKLRMFEMNLTQKSLAELLGVSSPRISEYLRGKREITLSLAKKLHKKLNIDAEIILQS